MAPSEKTLAPSANDSFLSLRHHEGMDRVRVERGWRVILRDMGIDPDDVARAAELPLGFFDLDDPRLSIPAFFRMWDALDTTIGDPLLPLRIAEAMRGEVFSPLVFACLCSANLSQAFQRMATYDRLTSPVRLVLEEREGALWIEKRWGLEAPTPTLLSRTEVVGLLQLARLGTRKKLRPRAVVLPEGLGKLQAPYEEFLGVRPTVGERTAIAFHLSDAQQPFLTASEALWQTFEPELRRQRDESHPTSTARRTRSALLELLPGGLATVQNVASNLRMSTRTLQRRLRSEGTSFQLVLRETRLELALHYLRNTKVSHNEIAFLLGFDKASSFFRAFGEWTGSTPEATRQANSIRH